MVLVCPHCRAKSRVADVQATSLQARVQCGACDHIFAAAAAERDDMPAAQRAQEALLRARQQRAQRLGFRPGEVVTLAAPALLVLWAVWLAVTGGVYASALPLTPHLNVQPPRAGLGRLVATATAYAPEGGAQGVLIEGTVSHNDAVWTTAPQLVVHIKRALQAATLYTHAGPQQTLAQAAQLSGEAQRPQALRWATPLSQRSLPFVIYLPAELLDGKSEPVITVNWLD